MKLLFEAIKGDFKKAYARQYGAIAQAATDTIKEAAGIVKDRGRGSIAAAGFSRKWQNALRVDVFPQRGVSVNAAAVIRHKIPYAGVFEDGAVINGRPFLWLPLSDVIPAGLTAANFKQKVGQPLRTIKRPGKPPLLAAWGRETDKRALKAVSLSLLKRGANVSVKNGNVVRGRGTLRLIPLFVGVPAANITKKFDVRGVVEKVRADLPALLLENLEKVANG